MSKPRLTVVVCSTRPRRAGAPVGAWFAALAQKHEAFDVDLVDLADLSLPILDEPEHPALREYQNDHTKRWSAIIDSSDSVVFVVPEYNHSFNAATKNAIDYLYLEWRDKAVGFVSYGGVSAGTRATQALRPVLLAVKAIPALESVSIPHVSTLVDGDTFNASDGLEKAAFVMLDEIDRRERVLRQLREGERR
ncbi:NAD(P)H-dependent oxidoreductase [Nocardioides sp. NPDC006303]|uniref:NADPH-dependent FMN reductase n=1 Tax=Nocardioides sp. NPDC006303 TaxID=3156747 RepID=UPI0033ACD846